MGVTPPTTQARIVQVVRLAIVMVVVMLLLLMLMVMPMLSFYVHGVRVKRKNTTELVFGNPARII